MGYISTDDIYAIEKVLLKNKSNTLLILYNGFIVFFVLSFYIYWYS